MDMARSILAANVGAIREDGTITPVDSDASLPDESGHAALALGEYYRATGQTVIDGRDIVDLCARCITAQTYSAEYSEDGLAYSSLGLLSFGPSKDRNIVWDKLLEETRKNLDKRLLARTDYEDYSQVFNIAKAVARFSMGLSKKDETGKLIDRFLERIQQTSSGNYFDDKPAEGLDGVFDISGVSAFVFIRQSLQLHANMHLRDRKIPSLRTFAEKYLRLFPDIVRQDGLGWAYGRGIGVYGQMHCISMILQSMRDNWITDEKMPEYMDILRRLFQFFFMTYLDQEHGNLVIKDDERSASNLNTVRTANFDAARYLCQWARLARTVGKAMQPKPAPARSYGKYIAFDNCTRKEQGLFVYRHAESGLDVHMPIVSSGVGNSSASLSFPHMPGVFDWPADKYLPIMLPELTFGENVTVPSYYGKRCTTSLGFRNSYVFRFDQPDLVTKDCRIIKGLGSCKVSWTFSGGKITGDFIYSVPAQTTLDRMRFVIAIAAPHSQHRAPMTCTIGEKGLGIEVEKDDFQGNWLDTEVVSEDPTFKTCWGKIHYLQVLERKHPMVMRPGQQYRLTVSFTPDVMLAD